MKRQNVRIFWKKLKRIQKRQLMELIGTWLVASVVVLIIGSIVQLILREMGIRVTKGEIISYILATIITSICIYAIAFIRYYIIDK